MNDYNLSPSDGEDKSENESSLTTDDDQNSTSASGDPSSDDSVGGFDFNRLRLDQNFVDKVAVKKQVLNILVSKPSKQQFVRTHPDSAYQADVALIKNDEDGEMYAVVPSLVPELSGLVEAYSLFTTITRQGTLSIWPVRLPDAGGMSHAAWDSQRAAIAKAQTEWLRIQWNREANAYDVFIATGDFPEPDWPDMSFDDILKVAFQGRLINSLNHTLIQKLKGLA